MATDITLIANFFIEKSAKEKHPLTPTLLHNYVYLAYGWYYGSSGKRLFNHEIYVDQFGAGLRHHSGAFIPELDTVLRTHHIDNSVGFIWDTIPVGVLFNIFGSPSLDTYFKDAENIRNLLELVWKSYSKIPSDTLANEHILNTYPITKALNTSSPRQFNTVRGWYYKIPPTFIEYYYTIKFKEHMTKHDNAKTNNN